jgi:hypothetical protein
MFNLEPNIPRDHRLRLQSQFPWDCAVSAMFPAKMIGAMRRLIDQVRRILRALNTLDVFLGTGPGFQRKQFLEFRVISASVVSPASPTLRGSA